MHFLIGYFWQKLASLIKENSHEVTRKVWIWRKYTFWWLGMLKEGFYWSPNFLPTWAWFLHFSVCTPLRRGGIILVPLILGQICVYLKLHEGKCDFLRYDTQLCYLKCLSYIVFRPSMTFLCNRGSIFYFYFNLFYFFPRSNH